MRWIAWRLDNQAAVVEPSGKAARGGIGIAGSLYPVEQRLKNIQVASLKNTGRHAACLVLIETEPRGSRGGRTRRYSRVIARPRKIIIREIHIRQQRRG